MRYTYCCEEHGRFLVTRSIHDEATKLEPCPLCQRESIRSFRDDIAPVHYNAQGFHQTDYWKGNVGNQEADKKEWLNRNWSKYYGEEPPKEDSKGTYDGT